MKKMTKIKINPSALSAREVEMCLNLRPSLTGPRGLVPTGAPAVVSDKGGIPVGKNGDMLLLARGNELWQTDGKNERLLGEFSGNIGAVMPVEAGRSIVMADKPLEISGDVCADAIPAPGFPALRRIDLATVSAPLPGRTLRGNYGSRSTTLEAADIATLTDDFLDAYCRLGDMAAGAGGFIAPVIAQVRLRGGDGNLLHTSAPVIIAPEVGLQAVETSMTVCDGDGGSTTSGAVLRATSFCIGVSFPATGEVEWSGEVASVEVLVSPQLHPVDAAVTVSGSFGSFQGGAGKLTVVAPGVESKGDRAAEGTRFHRRVVAALARIDDIMTVTVFGVSSAAGRVCNPSATDTRRQLTALVSVLGGKVKPPTDVMMRELSRPHTFTAAVARQSGDTVVWGDITCHRFPGYTAREMGVAHEVSQPAAVPTACLVKFADGSSVVTSMTEHCFNTLALSPLITYPHPDAVELTVIVGTRSVTVPLTPVGDGRTACWLDPQCRAVVPGVELGMFILPSATPRVSRFPDGVAVASRATPLDVAMAVRTGCGQVVELTPTVRTSSSWDFGRARFYAFTTSGICGIAVSGSTVTVAVIDSRGVTRKCGVATTSGGVAAIAGGDLVMVTGSRCVTLRENVQADMAGWCGSRGELWLTGSVDGKTLVCDVKGNAIMTRDDVAPVMFLSASPSLYMLDRDGKVLDASVEVGSPAREVSWRVRVPLGAWSAMTGMSVALSSSRYKGNVTLLADNGAGSAHALPVVDMAVDGEVNHPVVARLSAPLRRYATVAVSGVVSADTLIQETIISIEKWT